MTKEEQRIAVAEAVFDAVIAKDGMVLVQHPKGTEGYRGCDLSAHWIYKRADGLFYGSNYASADECRASNIQLEAIRHNYPEDLNAAFPLMGLIPCGWRMQQSYNGERGCWVIISDHPNPFSSTTLDVLVVKGETFAGAICETFLRTKGRWHDEPTKRKECGVRNV